jgi:hypothetical protein
VASSFIFAPFKLMKQDNAPPIGKGHRSDLSDRATRTEGQVGPHVKFGDSCVASSFFFWRGAGVELSSGHPTTMGTARAPLAARCP